MNSKIKTTIKKNDKNTVDLNYLELEKKILEKRKLVDEFLNQLNHEQRDNHHFIANIFSPNDHFLHIQESYGFNQWLKENKIVL